MKCRLLISIAILVLSQLLSIGVWAQKLEVLPELIWIFDNDVKPVRYQRLSQLHPVKHFNRILLVSTLNHHRSLPD